LISEWPPLDPSSSVGCEMDRSTQLCTRKHPQSHAEHVMMRNGNTPICPYLSPAPPPIYHCIIHPLTDSTTVYGQTGRTFHFDSSVASLLFLVRLFHFPLSTFYFLFFSSSSSPSRCSWPNDLIALVVCKSNKKEHTLLPTRQGGQAKQTRACRS
jgi:hypothetical protein